MGNESKWDEPQVSSGMSGPSVPIAGLKRAQAIGMQCTHTSARCICVDRCVPCEGGHNLHIAAVHHRRSVWTSSGILSMGVAEQILFRLK